LRFLHAADLHLDSPLAGLRAREDLPAQHLRHCTRRAFSKLIDLAIEEDVAFLLLAGDVFDADWKSFETGLFFAAEIRRLQRPCFMVRGNHDARSVITKSLPRPDNLHEFPAERAGSVVRHDLRVAIHGRSFAARTATENLAASYPPPAPGLLNIGLLHSSAEDRGEHETYAPCTVGELAARGYDYWALGHIHDRRVLHEAPWIVFPGNLQGRHARETGPKGAVLVHVEHGRIARIEHRALDVLRWARIEVDATGADVLTLQERLRGATEAAIADAHGRPVVARLVFTGATALHARLVTDHDEEAALALDAADAAGGALWIETVRAQTRPARGPDGEAMDALKQAFDAVAADPARRAALLDDLAALRRELPAPVREAAALPRDDTALAALIEEAWAIVLAEAGAAR